MNRTSLLMVALLAMGATQTACGEFPEFRATPFTAQGERTDPDRVNIWPLVYAQNDAMSAFFNFYSHSDIHVAFHPFFSIYRDTPASPYTSYNTLFGLYHLDTGKGMTWLPPYWSWNGRGLSRSNMFFPLWLKNDSGFYSWLYAQTDSLRSIPLLLSFYDPKDDWAFALPLLSGWNESFWYSVPLLSFYDSDKESLFTPLYFQNRRSVGVPVLFSFYRTGITKDSFFALPLLSFGEWGRDNRSIDVLLGLLYHHKRRETPAAKNSSDVSILALSGGGVFDDGKRRVTSWTSVPLLSGGRYVDETDGSHDYIDFDVLGIYYHRDTLDTKAKNKGGTYRRHSIIWKLWDWREEDGNVSLDCFPGVTYNSGSDGSESFSFLWRLYRYARDANGGEKLDLFFIPLKRTSGK